MTAKINIVNNITGTGNKSKKNKPLTAKINVAKNIIAKGQYCC